MLHRRLLRRVSNLQYYQFRSFSVQNGPDNRTSVCPNDLEQFEFLSSTILPKIKEHINANQNEAIPISTNISFHELKSIVSYPETLPNEPVSIDTLMYEIDLILKHSPRSSKSRFIDKLYSGSDSITQYASFLLSVINNNTQTYKSAQILNVLENITIRNLCEVFYKQTSDPYGGLFMPGGAYSNMMAIRLARDKYFPTISSHGLQPLEYNPIVLTSDQSHYSIMTAVAQVGIGTNNVIKVETHHNGTMNIGSCVAVIEQEIQNQQKPFMLSCTAGTTVLRAFDDFKAIREICDKYDIWMHVDGCWGGAATFCGDTNDRLNKLVDGIELADSISFDAHKLLSTGLLCGVLLVKDENYLLNSCTPPNASYLFHGAENEVNYDIGLKTLQCGRVSDALKLYLNWLYYGKNGLCERVENGMNNASYLCKLIEESNDFILVREPDFCNVCFWYVDPLEMDKVRQWKQGGFDASEKEIVDMLGGNTKKIHGKMEKEGNTMINYSPLKSIPLFFRMITSNYRLNYNEVETVLNDVRRAAGNL
eukprot:278428_1